MNIDTGDSGYGYTGKCFYSKNKKFIKSKGISAIFRKAGKGIFTQPQAISYCS